MSYWEGQIYFDGYTIQDQGWLCNAVKSPIPKDYLQDDEKNAFSFFFNIHI